MSRYMRGKENARQEAKDFQATFSEESYTWTELAITGARFEKLARRYGLIREFRDNGII